LIYGIYYSLSYFIFSSFVFTYTANISYNDVKKEYYYHNTPTQSKYILNIQNFLKIKETKVWNKHTCGYHMIKWSVAIWNSFDLYKRTLLWIWMIWQRKNDKTVKKNTILILLVLLLTTTAIDHYWEKEVEECMVLQQCNQQPTDMMIRCGMIQYNRIYENALVAATATVL